MSPAIPQASGSAQAKVILFGEHAVVHGTDALATALDRGVTVTATRRSGPALLEVHPWGYTVDSAEDTPGARALHAVFDALGIAPRDIALRAQAEIPARSGLGASAALAAATTRALCSLEGLTPNDEQLFSCVQGSEAVFHGNPSGIDAQVALFGGTVLYNKNRPARQFKQLELHFSVIHSGRPGDTSSTVKLFAQKLGEDPEARERLDDIQRIVDAAVRTLLEGDSRKLGPLMDQNQDHLRWFGISTEELDEICSIAKQNGAAGAKLTGGGGGGCALILEEFETNRATSALAKAGYQVVTP